MKKNWLRISSTDDGHWNVLTWIVLVALFVMYAYIAELLFGTWTWAFRMVGLGFGAVGEAGHFGPRAGRQAAGGATLMVWLCMLLPLMMAGVPAVATLLGLSLLFNPRKKSFDD